MVMFGLLLPGDSLLISALCPVRFFSLLFLFSRGHCESWKYTESLRLQSLSSPSLLLLRSPCGWTEYLSEAKRSRVCVCKTHTWGSTSHHEPFSSSGLLSLSQRKFRKCVISGTFVHIDSRLEWFCPPEDSQNGYQCLVKMNDFNFWLYWVFCINSSWLTAPFLDQSEKTLKWNWWTPDWLVIEFVG